MVENITDKNFEQKIKESCVVDFYADWCGPCKMLTPILESISNDIKDKKFYKINVDENQETAQKYGIKSIPATFIFKNGKVVKKIIGYKQKKALTEELNVN